MKKISPFFVCFFVVFALGSCQKSTAYSHPLTINGTVLQVELAKTPEEQRMGLMHRTSMKPLEGMLFVYPKEQLLSFWMKNTHLALSIAYIDGAGVIREIHDMHPFDLTSVPSKYPVRYALELNQGQFAALNINVGDKVHGLP